MTCAFPPTNLPPLAPLNRLTSTPTQTAGTTVSMTDTAAQASIEFESSKTVGATSFAQKGKDGGFLDPGDKTFVSVNSVPSLPLCFTAVHRSLA